MIWEYETFCVNTSNGADLNLYWKKNGKPVIDINGISPLDHINKKGAEGWELVSVTSISWTYDGRTDQIIFTFKRSH